MRKRFLSLILCVAMLLSLLPAVGLPVKVAAATANQNNIVARADYFYNITWLCQKTVTGWNGNYTFYSGTSYRMPYGQPINSGAYIGYGVSVDSFVSATKSASSVFYTSRSTYGTTSSVYYATDCSAFVSLCWGIDRKTTYSLPLTSGVSYIGMATQANASKLQLGDCLNSNSVGHVVLVTDLTYNSSGTLTQIEITEQTPPQLKRSYYTPASLGSKYGADYGIYRYSGTVPSAPNSVSNVGKYFPACGSSYTSLYPALESIGIYCDWSLHCRIAAVNGISGFTGTVEQNTQLLNLLKQGKLLNPDYADVTYYPACGSSFTSLYPALESIGISCDWDLHCRIAAVNGISGFTGTVEQNTQLLNLLKAGKLINPDGSSGSSGSGSGTGSFANGYENGYTGGMAGDGKIYAHGLDVSSWQGAALDFKAIKNAGYDYVILRAGTSKGKDTCFETYYQNARAAGLDIGTYYYTYATSVAAAQTDANNMLSWIKGKTFEYPVYFDYEDPSQDGLGSATAQSICLTFCDAMAKAGYLTGIYTGYYKSTQLPISTICAKYEIWIANYWDYGYSTLSPSYSTKYGMYQYTDRNYIGSAGPFDGNVVFKDYPSIVKKYGFNGYAGPENFLDQCTYSPTHCIIETITTSPLNSLPCSVTSSYGSETLIEVEAGNTYTATGIYLNTSGNYWYRIILDDGRTAYIFSDRCVVKEFVNSDVTASSISYPKTVYQPENYSVGGTVSSTWNKLDKVTLSIYRGDDLSATPVQTATLKAKSNSVDLAEATLDFTSLEIGDYTYSITAQYTGYYAASAKEIASYTETLSMHQSAFTVKPYAPYMERCTFYPAYCKVTTANTAPINTMPCKNGTYGSELVLSSEANVTYTVIGLYRNASENLWYQLKLDNGKIAYLNSSHTTYGRELIDDISLTNCVLPGDMMSGETFNATGTLGATYNQLQAVTVTVYADNTPVISGTAQIDYNMYRLNGSTLSAGLDFASLPAGNYRYEIAVTYTNYFAAPGKELVSNLSTVVLVQSDFAVTGCDHNFVTRIVQSATCTIDGIVEQSCLECGFSTQSTVIATGHQYSSKAVVATCTEAGGTKYTCVTCGDMFIDKTISATGHSYSQGSCTTCGTADPNYAPAVIRPTLTLKSPNLEFKDMICINAFYTAENIQDVVEMGMITYDEKVTALSVDTADYVIPGATYDAGSGRYYSSSQGIHAKNLADTVYLAIYAKLKDGSYAYSKLAPYSAVTYANSQLKNSTDAKLKQLVVAMLNYGAEAQLYFGHNTGSLANASLTAAQKALPETYRADMVKAVPAASAMKQGNFANNSGFASRKPAVSFESAFCINYFFTPKYVPDGGITLYYWDATAYNRAGILTTSNATGKFKLEGSGTGEYSSKIEGIAAKELSTAVYVAAAYKSGGVVWTSGALGYSIGAYCSSQASQGGAVANLAKATAVYGYHAKQYFA